MQYEIACVKGKYKLQRKKQVAEFIIKTDVYLWKKDRLKKLRSLTFAKTNIEKNVKERVLFKNYEERFERSLHLWFSDIGFKYWNSKTVTVPSCRIVCGIWKEVGKFEAR